MTTMTLRVSMENEVRGLIYDLTQKVNNYDDYRDIIRMIEQKVTNWHRMEHSQAFVLKEIMPPAEREHKQRAGPIISISPDSPHAEKIAEYY